MLGGATANGNRLRSGSVQKTMLQVTTDNEQFFVVDITGVHSSDGIRERIFSRLRFRDELHPSLSIYRTDIGEQPNPNALDPQALLQLCQDYGDAKASLKFLVVQTGILSSASAPVVPPQDTFRSRPGVPPIVTDMTPVPPYAPPTSGHHSNNSSLSSSAEAMDRGSGSRTSITSVDDANILRAQGRLGSTSSRSPMTDPSAIHNPRSLHMPPVHADGSVSSPNLPLDSQADDDEGTYRPNQQQPLASGSSANASAGPSSSDSLATADMDEATKQLILDLQRADEEEDARRQAIRQATEEADKRLAMQEQENEREVWQLLQQFDQEHSFVGTQTVRPLSPHFALANLPQLEMGTQQDRRPEQERHQTAPSTYTAPSQQHTTTREHGNDRSADFVQQRRERREHFRAGGVADWAAHIPEESPIVDRRRSEGIRQAPPPHPARMYTSPPSLYNGESSTGSYDNRPPGYTSHDPRMSNRTLPPQPRGEGSQRRNPPYISTQGDDRRLADSGNQPLYGGLPQSHRQGSGGRNGMPSTPIHSEPQGYMGPPDHRYADSRTSMAYDGIVPFPSPQPRQSWPIPEPANSPPRQHSTMHGDHAPSSSGGLGRRSNASHEYGYASNNRHRSGSDSRVYHDNGQPQMPPYVHRTSDGPWLSAPPRRDTIDSNSTADGASVAGTVISDATTIHAPSLDESTVSTVRASDRDEWGRFQNVIDGRGAISDAQTLLRNRHAGEDQDEATLFFSGSGASADTSPRPPLYVNTHAQQRRPVSSSDSESDSGGIQRVRSFAARGRDNDWHVRPEPEQLYDNLQEFFPKIDIDAPFVDPAVLSTPTTPSSDSPRNTIEMHRPPPQHPARQQTPTSSNLNARADDIPSKPPQHPARAAVAAGVAAMTAAFNKSEYRRSIRNVADIRRRSIQRNREADGGGRPGAALPAPNNKNDVGVRRSSSMWDHPTREVRPSREQEIPPTVPESPSSDGRPSEFICVDSADYFQVTFNWVKGELIGKGSYGRVYLAMNVTTGDMMAVKQVEQLAGGDAGADPRQTSVIKALQSEISLLKDLYHPNIVTYLGCETSPEYLSIFLEYVPGGTIAAIYRTPNQARFEEQLVKFFTSQILDGLAYLHREGIWHRDLKGDNILVDAKGVCKISDFGISKQMDDAYDSFGNGTMMKGSVFWMAPELISRQGQGRYSGKVDIWSLGCVVLEMWTGSRPWGNCDQVAAMFAVSTRVRGQARSPFLRPWHPTDSQLFNGSTPQLPSDIQLDAMAHEFLYTRCLSHDPAKRPTAVELLQDPFITDRDPNWTFSESKIGKAVTKRSEKARAEKTMRSASAGAMGAVSGSQG